jgi:mono/diheme cytochrome c family protein
MARNRFVRSRVVLRLAGCSVRRLGGLAALLCSFLAILLFTGAPVVRAQQQGTPQSPPYDAAQVTVPATPPLALAGQPIYQENCAPCHGVLGMADGPTAADLPSPATAFADPLAAWERSPAQWFHTTKFGRLEMLMPPWQNQLSDEQIWQAVAYAWSLHTTPAQIEAGEALYAASCAACHGDSGQGDGPEAQGELNDFSDLSYTIFRSPADWSAGWQSAHPEIGAEWTVDEQNNTLEYVRTFSYWPPWQSSLQPGDGVIAGTVVQGTAGATAPADLPIVLEAYVGFEQLATFTSTVGADGAFRFEGLATDPNINYLATVATNGISYSSDFLNLSPITTTLQTQLAVYATTDDPAAVRINSSHWIIDQQPGALVGLAIYIFGNSGDRTFVGQTVEGVDQPVTAAIEVPPGAVEITLEGGALGERFFQVGNIIYDTLPLLPGEGTRQLVVQYAVPFTTEAVDLAQQFLYPVEQLNLLVPTTSGLQVSAPAMTAAAPQNMGGQEYQLFVRDAFEPQVVSVNLTGLLPAGSPDPRAAAATGATGETSAAGELGTAAPPLASSVTWVMGALVTAALLGVLGLAVQRGALSTQYTRQGLNELRESLLQRMAHLDDLRAMGTINSSEWMRQRAYLKAQLVDVMQKIEGNATHKEAADA